MGSHLFAALLLIVVGLFLLAQKLGWMSSSIGNLLATWWPAALVLVGVALLFKRK